MNQVLRRNLSNGIRNPEEPEVARGKKVEVPATAPGQVGSSSAACNLFYFFSPNCIHRQGLPILQASFCFLASLPAGFHFLEVIHKNLRIPKGKKCNFELCF